MFDLGIAIVLEDDVGVVLACCFIAKICRVMVSIIVSAMLAKVSRLASSLMAQISRTVSGICFRNSDRRRGSWPVLPASRRMR